MWNTLFRWLYRTTRHIFGLVTLLHRKHIMAEKERRTTLRFTMPVPISVVDDSTGTEIHGETRDISSSGLSLFSAGEVAVGSAVTFGLQLPGEITLTKAIKAHGTACVVRREPQPDGRFLIGVRLNSFEFA